MTKLKYLVLGLFVLLICLGCWQLQRAQEKFIILNQIKSDEVFAGLDCITEYRRYRIDGEFLYDRNMFLYSTNSKHSEKQGYFIITPFCTGEGSCIAVNRGWIPLSLRHIFDKKNEVGTTHIVAMAVRAKKANIFLPYNDLPKNTWFYYDLGLMSYFSKAELDKEFYMILVSGNNLPEDLILKNPEELLNIRNDHLSYAITWFLLALCLLIIVAAPRIKSLSSQRNCG